MKHVLKSFIVLFKNLTKAMSSEVRLKNRVCKRKKDLMGLTRGGISSGRYISMKH